MKHNADQFELFAQVPFVPGELVRLLEWHGNKPRASRTSWRVISWPLYFLLSGEDPEGWKDEFDDWDRHPPDFNEVPILRTELPPDVHWWSKSIWMETRLLQLRPRGMLSRGY